MKRIDIGAVPLFDDGKAIGMLTDRDITVRLVAEGRDPIETKAMDIMSPGVISCTVDTDIEEAAQMMKDGQVRRLLVLDDQKNVAGIVSLGDLSLRLGREIAGETIREVSRPSKPAR